MILNDCNRISIANDHLLSRQVLSSRGSCGHALQATVLSRAYGAAFKYPDFDCQSTPSNPPVSDRETGKQHYFRTTRQLSSGDSNRIAEYGPFEVLRFFLPVVAKACGDVRRVWIPGRT
jgi:hypothetical protein